MRIFEHPNMLDFKCPICHTNDDKSVTLIPISGTQEGNKEQAIQVHIECIDLLVVRPAGGITRWLIQTLEPES